jgi:3-methyladenine DNA glycosylase Mpg
MKVVKLMPFEAAGIYPDADGFSAAYKTGKRIGTKSATEEYRDKLWRFTLQ